MNAIENLTKNQKQLDDDGINVGVSRQALNEVLRQASADKEKIAELEKRAAAHATVESLLRGEK